MADEIVRVSPSADTLFAAFTKLNAFSVDVNNATALRVLIAQVIATINASTETTKIDPSQLQTIPVSKLTPVPKAIITGFSTFNSSTGRVITHNLNLNPTAYTVQITPTADPQGRLGEYWVIKGTNSVTVFNSGAATSGFDYAIIS